MKKIIITAVVLAASLTSFAQWGVSSGSLALIRSNGLNSRNEMGALNERTIIVEDFINYHKHAIEIPTREDIALSIDYDNGLLRNENEFVLQIGLATRTQKENAPKTNVNVALVIDRSGSMGGGKLEKVKAAVKEFVKGLGDSDYISIVTFDDAVSVNLASMPAREARLLMDEVIDKIYPGGSTNINQGMLAGYQEAEKQNKKEYHSRVILLTDGMTNTGETNIEKIIENSKEFNTKGIEITTIGVGQSLDFDLLRQLSEAGRGSNHFIGDNEEDIQKVFITELESLLYHIGKNPEVTITLPEGYKIKEFYGYNPVFMAENKVVVKPENLNYGQTEVFLVRVEKSNAKSKEIRVVLRYDVDDQKVEMKKEVAYNAAKSNTNKEVKKNYQIAYMASSLKGIAREYAQNNQENVKSLISETLSYISTQADTEDQDIKRIYEIFKDLNQQFGALEEAKLK